MTTLRRPLAVTGFSMLIAMSCLFNAESTALIICTLILAAAVILCCTLFSFRRAYFMTAASVGIICACIFCLSAEYRHSLTLSHCSEKTQLEAVICEQPEFSKENVRYYAVARLKSMDGERVSGKVRLSFSESLDDIDPDSLEIGDRVRLTATTYKIGEQGDIHNSFRAKGIYIGAYSIRIQSIIEPALRPLSFYTAQLKEHISKTLSFSFGDEIAGVIIAMLTGDKEDCPEDIYRAFRNSGASHLMAVSGIHLTIWVGVVAALFSFGAVFDKVKYIFMLVVAVLVMFIACFSPSACRAALMVGVLAVGKLLDKDADSLNSIGFSLVCILTANPYSVYSVSLQLSYACVLAIVLLAVPVSNYVSTRIELLPHGYVYKRPLMYVVTSLLISILVAIFTYPVCSVYFGSISLVSPITNLLLVSVSPFLLVLSMIFVIFNWVPVLGGILHGAVELLCRYFLFVTDKLSALSLSTVVVSRELTALWLILCLLLVAGVLLFRINYKKHIRHIALLMCFAVIISLLHITAKRTDTVYIEEFYTGQRPSAVVTYNGKSVVIGCNDGYYFTEQARNIIDKHNSDTVALIYYNDTDKRSREYICADLDCEQVLDYQETVVLFSDVEIINCKDKAVVKYSDKSYELLI